MYINTRIEKLEKKLTPGNGVTVIDMQKGETEEQARKRYCIETGINIRELDYHGSMVIFLVRDFE